MFKSGHLSGIRQDSKYNCYLCLHTLEEPKHLFDSSRKGVVCSKCKTIFCTWCVDDRRIKDTRCPKCLVETSPPMMIMIEKTEKNVDDN